MSRTNPWRTKPTDLISWRQDQAERETIFIVRQTGPTAFSLKQESQPSVLKTSLGNPNYCSCSQFAKDKETCLHICWLLLKKFRLPRTNPVTWQSALVEREINSLLQGTRTAQQAPSVTKSVKKASNSLESSSDIPQKQIEPDDVCPICQEEFLDKKLPVTYCRRGCGNNIHIKCMQVWAEHQLRTATANQQLVKCPLCREDFASLQQLQAQSRNSEPPRKAHKNVKCHKCSVCPINGKIYRCSNCTDLFLCHSCFTGAPYHMEHNFVFKENDAQKWRPVSERFLLINVAPPPAVAEDLMNRELQDSDYETLLNLDRVQSAGQTVPERALQNIPLRKVRKAGQLLLPGKQCRMCLLLFKEGDYVRRLPCRHEFHRACIDAWLMHKKNSCPIDGLLVWSPTHSEALAKALTEAAPIQPTDLLLQQTRKRARGALQSDERLPELEIAGMTLAFGTNSASGSEADNRKNAPSIIGRRNGVLRRHRLGEVGPTRNGPPNLPSLAAPLPAALQLIAGNATGTKSVPNQRPENLPSAPLPRQRVHHSRNMSSLSDRFRSLSVGEVDEQRSPIEAATDQQTANLFPISLNRGRHASQPVPNPAAYARLRRHRTKLVIAKKSHRQDNVSLNELILNSRSVQPFRDQQQLRQNVHSSEEDSPSAILSVAEANWPRTMRPPTPPEEGLQAIQPNCNRILVDIPKLA